MSWLFSRALVAEYSAANCLDGEQSAQLNVMPTQHKFWSNDKTMDVSNLSRFGLTFRVLTEQDGADVLMSFLEGFHVKTSVAPVAELGSTANEVDFGRKWQGSFAKYNPASSSWRTAQCSLLADSDEFLETWPQWGSMRNGECFQRQEPAHLTCVNASGLWPTPDASCGRRGWSKTVAEKVATGDRTRKSGAKIGSSLAWEPRLLEDYAPGMRLNPDWLEWLMGWPIAHTALLPLETARFQEWQQQHSLSLPADFNKAVA